MFRKFLKGLRNIPSFFAGYNVYVSVDKLNLLSNTFKNLINADSAVDLGGAWNVHSAYTHFMATRLKLGSVKIIDTNFDPVSIKSLNKSPNTQMINGDFGSDEIIKKVGNVDAVILFDVLLHQVKPNWNDILKKYAPHTNCFIIYNQQFTKTIKTIRLTDLPLDEYISIAPYRKDDFYNFVYDHADEICPEYQKKWKDVHNIWQWGIVDNDLRSELDALGFKEIFYKNYGKFSNLKYFENHAFVFVR